MAIRDTVAPTENEDLAIAERSMGVRYEPGRRDHLARVVAVSHRTEVG
ncbi:Uncharacterised protein [Mycobacteroides abscessus subsp. abscessus]|nr:Uncharacterised protein [Mycobacteroides abscessus subsp. abscessus]